MVDRPATPFGAMANSAAITSGVKKKRKPQAMKNNAMRPMRVRTRIVMCSILEVVAKGRCESDQNTSVDACPTRPNPHDSMAIEGKNRNVSMQHPGAARSPSNSLS